MRIFNVLKRTLNKQLGFTLIETMIALCITGVVAVSVVTTIYQLRSISNIHYAHVMSVKQVENAVFFLNRDIQQAQTIQTDVGGNWLKLNWTSWDTSQHQITYKFTNVVNNIGELIRNDGTVNNTIAKSINTSSSDTNASYDSATHTLVLQLTSTVKSGNKQNTETRKISIIPRPGS
jgi:prepilin-type N-terminal cleavage/methylation domain-containing protein